MIDNGSTGSILSSRKYSELKNDLEPLVRPFNTSVYDASGNIIPSYGAVAVKISLGGCDFEQTMIICDIKQDGVIGQNFLLIYAENINYKHGRINTKINEIYCWLGDRSSVKCRVIVRLTTVIPSLAVSWLPIEIPGSENLTNFGYVEPSKECSADLAIIPGIMNMSDTEKCLSVVNQTETPITMYANQPVGMCEPYVDQNDDTGFYHDEMNNIDNEHVHESLQSQACSPGDGHVHGPLQSPTCSLDHGHVHETLPFQMCSPDNGHVHESFHCHMYSADSVPNLPQNIGTSEITTHMPPIVTCEQGKDTQSEITFEKCREHTNIQLSAFRATSQCVDNSTNASSSLQNNSEHTVPDYLQDMYIRSSKHLSESEKIKLAELLNEYKDIFAKSSSDLGRCDKIKHSINTGTAFPVRQPARRLPFGKRKAEQEEIMKMLDRGVIEPSNSPWSSLVVLVTKKDGSIRFCVDYRVLNSLTVKDAYPIPRVDECLDALSGSKWYSSMDLNSGFWQVGLREEDQEKTAFATSLGLFQFTVMPFGLANAPSTFERLVENIFSSLNWVELLLYMDDIISPCQSIEQGLQRLRRIFDRLRESNLKLKPSKCTFFQREAHFLGHVVSESGVSTDPEKLSAINDWPTPQSAREVKSFLGLCSYYRRYVKNFAAIARPLHMVSDKKKKFSWDQSCQQAFEQLKAALTSSDILAYPIHGLPFVLDTDSSDKSVGAVLSQVQDGRERVIAYMSKVMNKHEQLYCTTRKELLAVVQALRTFHSYLYGQKVLLRTDNSAVSWLRQLKNPTGQVARWIQEIETYDLEVQHRPGLKHTNADALSRRPCRVCERQERLSTEAQQDVEDDPECSAHTGKSAEVGDDGVIVRDLNETLNWDFSQFVLEGWSAEEIHSCQTQDVDIHPLLTALESGSGRPKWDQVSSGRAALKTLWRQWDKLQIKDGVLYCQFHDADLDEDYNRLVVPSVKRPDLLHHFHDIPTAGHLRSDKMIYRLKRSFYWPGLKEDVIQYCNSCDICVAKKTPANRKKAPMKHFQVGEPMEKIAIDILGPLVKSQKGNRFILVLADCFSKWTEAYALPNQEAKTIAEVIVNEFICRFGTPLQILSDQGSNFQSKLFTEVCEMLKIDKVRTSSMRPQANGTVERFNRTLQNMLTSFCEKDQRTWDQYLPQLMMAYRASQNSSTHLTPNRLMLGKEVVLPTEVVTGLPSSGLEHESCPDEEVYVTQLRTRLSTAHEIARRNLHSQAVYRKRKYDLKASKQSLEPGQPVWLYNPTRRVGVCSKLTSKWKGPYVVIRKLDDVTYLVKNSPKQRAKVYHIDRLIPYRGRNPPRWFDKAKVKGGSQ